MATSKVRDDVSDRVRTIIALKEEEKEASSAKKQQSAEGKPRNVPTSKVMVSVEPTQPLAKIFPSVSTITPQPSSDWENAERSVALFFFENKLDFSIARSPSYQQMLDAVARCSHGFRGPSSEALRTTWLQRIKSEVSQQSKGIEREMATTGCTIIADTWMDNKSKAVINFLVSSPSGTFFHKSVDASTSFKSTKYLADLFDSVIHDIGPENIVQVILDNALNYSGIGNHIMQNYSMIFCSPCASHCLSLILEEFSKIDWVHRCIVQAQSISKFIYNYTWVLDLMKKFTGGQELVRTSITRFASTFLTLQSMLKQRQRVRHMFNSPEYSTSQYANKTQSIACVDLMDDNDLWRAVDEIVAVSEPILRVLRDVSGGKPAVGSIYESMTRAKESIRTYYIMDENKCKLFLDIVDRWQKQLHSPLHSAAAFLNPSIQYNPEIKFLGHIKEEFLTVLDKLLPTPEFRHDITGQIFAFRKAQGMFGCTLARESINTTAPALWWDQYGDLAPGLQRIAVRLLSQVCSASTYERNWSTMQQNVSEKRNRLEKETANDLLFINYNLKVAARAKGKAGDIDPIIVDDIDMTSDWVEETENPSPTQWLDRFGSALDGSDLNTRQFNGSIFTSNDHIFGL